MKKKKHLQNIDYLNSFIWMIFLFVCLFTGILLHMKLAFFQDAGMYSGETGEKTEAHYRTTQH